MERVLEPELMDDPEQAEAYAYADFADVNQGFADRFCAAFSGNTSGQVLDLGCGPADIPIRIARALPGLRITAVDASAAMLAFARGAVAAAGLAERISLVRAQVPDLPLRAGCVDAVISNSLLHHLPNAGVFWRCVQRLARPDACILVMDLFRPETAEAAQALVDAAAAREPAILRRDFFNSLRAAFTPAEVACQLRDAGLGHVEPKVVSERHWVVTGSFSPP